MQSANDNPPSAKAFRAAENRRQEAKAIAQLSARIAARQAIGDDWDGTPANDNMAWPLAKALLAEGNTDLLSYAVRYRQIEASATSDALFAAGVGAREHLPIDHETSLNGAGELVYGKARISKSAQSIGDMPARKASVTTDESTSRSSSVAKKWNGDAPLLAMIDDKRTLVRLHVALGPLVDRFEDLVVRSETYETVGQRMGVGPTRGAQYAARAMVHMGLATVRGVLGQLEWSDVAA